MKRWVLVPFLFCALYSWAIPQSERLPRYRGWVNDFAGVISSYYEEKMSVLAAEVKRKTGAETAVVTVEDMGGLEIEEYAVKLFETWGIGEQGKDNGILLLLAMAERKVRIEVGYGLEGILPDGRVGDILDTSVLPDFRNNDFGRGLYMGLVEVTRVIADDAGVEIAYTRRVERPSRSSERRSGGGLFFIIFLIFLMIVTRGRILPWLFLGMMMGGGRGGGGFSGGGFGGGFGGFGGGMSGGGGASRGF
jgi:uncharacterized protein